MTAEPLRPGIWALRSGGYFLRTRVADPRTGKVLDYQRILRGVTLNEAAHERQRLQSDARDLVHERKQAPMLWSEFAAWLFEAKVNEGKIKSAKNREHWVSVLTRVIPGLGHFYTDELRYADLAAWRADVARWIRHGMPSIRKRDAGQGKLVKLAPVTANGWIAIVKVICRAMTKHFELERDPSAGLENFPVPRTYTREEPNALTPAQAVVFLAMLKDRYPQHYAIVLLGFVIGARPSALRPLRRKGPCADVVWEKGQILLRRSHSLGQEIMDQTKTSLDQELPLPETVMKALEEHIKGLEGVMAESDYLFPSTTGGLRATTALMKPFADVLKVLGWNLRFTPRGMRRTFNDLARKADVNDIVTQAISGHLTEEMHRHYSTAQLDEMRAGMTRVVSLLTPNQSGGTSGGSGNEVARMEGTT